MGSNDLRETLALKGRYVLSRPAPILSVDCGDTILGTTFILGGAARLKEWRGKGLHASYALVVFFFSDGMCRSDLQL